MRYGRQAGEGGASFRPQLHPAAPRDVGRIEAPERLLPVLLAWPMPTPGFERILARSGWSRGASRAAAGRHEHPDPRGRAMAHDTTAGPHVSLRHEAGFHFRVRFRDGHIPELCTDEPPPLGDGTGPNPTALLATAIANCLAASLLFCMQRARLEPAALTAEADVTLHRNEQGRLRIHGVRVTLAPSVDDDTRAKMGRCLEVFESFCVVTQSVRQGFPIEVEVRPCAPAPAPGHRVDEYARPVEEG